MSLNPHCGIQTKCLTQYMTLVCHHFPSITADDLNFIACLVCLPSHCSSKLQVVQVVHAIQMWFLLETKPSLQVLLNFICMPGRAFFISMAAGDFVTSWKFMQCPQCLVLERGKKNRKFNIGLRSKHETFLVIQIRDRDWNWFAAGGYWPARRRKRSPGMLHCRINSRIVLQENANIYESPQQLSFQKPISSLLQFETTQCDECKKQLWNQFHILSHRNSDITNNKFYS